MPNALIIYRVDISDPVNKGVIDKMRGYKDGLETLEWSVDYIVQSSTSIFYNQDIIYQADNLMNKKLLALNWFEPVLTHVIGQSYDLVIIRYGLSTPSFISFLHSYRYRHPECKLIIDMPTFPYELEWKGMRARLILCIDKFYRKKLNQTVDAVIHLGDEKQIFGIPTILTSNGILINELIEPREVAPWSGTLQLIAVAKWQYWHGLDRLLAGMRKSSIPCYLNVVGDGPELAHLKKKVKKLKIGDRVRFHGPLLGEQLDDLFSKSHLAIGTLGLHRKGVVIDSSIKHRDYCRRGVPFVMSAEDRDFPEGLPFVLHIPQDNSPISIEDIMNFVHSLSSRFMLGKEMQNYARTHLSWRQKVGEILQKIEALSG